MRAAILYTALTLIVPFAAQASDKAAQAAVETVQAALERGHGGMCSLTNVPVQGGGYWRCLDIPPYRFVAGYGRLTGFVVVEGQAPYPILVSENGNAQFTARGRWMTDMGPRVGTWWDDEVMGGRSRREEEETGGARHRDAEAQIERMSPGGREQQPAPQAEVPAGQGTSPSQPQPLEPIAGPRAPPAPAGAGLPRGAVQVAPGVVGYPNGVPGR